MKNLQTILEKCVKSKVIIYTKFWELKISHLYKFNIWDEIFLLDNKIIDDKKQATEHWINKDNILWITIIHRETYYKNDNRLDNL